MDSVAIPLGDRCLEVAAEILESSYHRFLPHRRSFVIHRPEIVLASPSGPLVCSSPARSPLDSLDQVSPTLALTPELVPPPSSSRAASASIAVYGAPGVPPAVHTILASETPELLEALFEGTLDRAALPPLAVREIVENLVHAEFRGALVSILDGGHTVRVSDAGPGISDPELALRPGYTTAGPAARRLIRGVGSGLATARALMGDAGGSLEICSNLGRGAAVTLTVGGGPVLDAGAVLSSRTRAVLTLLLELEIGAVADLAAELGIPLSCCGRELAELEQRGLVSRGESGARSLTEAGRDLVATLF